VLQAWYGSLGWQWSLCCLLVLWWLMLVTTVTFLTVWALVVEIIPTLMSCQYTSNRSVQFIHRLGCYDNSNEIYLTTILKHFACVRIWCTNVSHIKCVEVQSRYHSPFHCHSNRNILSPILLTCSDDVSLILRLSPRPIDKWIWRGEPGIDSHVILRHNDIIAIIAKFMTQMFSHLIGWFNITT